MSFEENLAKEKKRKGIAYLVASSIFWIIFLVSWLQSALGIEMHSITEFLLSILFRFFFPFIGLALAIKGIITLAKRNNLKRRQISMSVTPPKGYTSPVDNRWKGYNPKYTRKEKVILVFGLTFTLAMGLFIYYQSIINPASVTTTYDPEDIFILGVIGLIIGVPLFIAGLITLKKKKLMESHPTSKIRSLAIGIAEINGKVVPDKGIMKSPFSNRDCVGVKIIIDQYSTEWDEHISGDWLGVKKLVRGIEFFLQDDTGKVLVDLRGAELFIPVSYEFESGSRAGLPPIYGTLSEDEINELEELVGGNKSMRYSESIIMPGDELYILGRADNYPKFREGGALHGVQDLMMQQSHNPSIYLIATSSEKLILPEMNKKIIALTFAGLFFLGGGLFVMALNFEPILSLMMVLGINR